LFSELQTLRTLAPGLANNPDAITQIESVYAAHIDTIESLDAAFRQLQAGLKFGDMTEASDALHDRLLANLEMLSSAPLDSNWLSAAEQTLSYSDKYFPSSSRLAAVRLELMEQLNDEMSQVLLAKNVLLAEQAWNTFGDDIFDFEAWLETDTLMHEAVMEARKKRAVALAERTASNLNQGMAELLNVSCLRLDIGLVAGRLRAVAVQYPTHEKVMRDQVGERVGECVQRLGALDPDRAWSMQAEALQQLGELEQLKHSGVDPCSMHYLVGNGSQSGRGSSCADQISTDDRGPRLVVVPGGASLPNFAISKYEISWREFNSFCTETNRCEGAGEEQLPVTGVAVDVIEAYAAWLSEKTGYRYRLPSRSEWHQITQGEPDPNRNCRVDVGGVSRGDSMLAAENGAVTAFGLVHVLGNAQELIKEVFDYVAVGGTYSDPIDMCLAETQRVVDPEGDANTGFRLVREVS